MTRDRATGAIVVDEPICQEIAMQTARTLRAACQCFALLCAAAITPLVARAQDMGDSAPNARWQAHQHGHGQPSGNHHSGHDDYWPDQPTCPATKGTSRVGSDAWVAKLRECRQALTRPATPCRIASRCKSPKP